MKTVDDFMTSVGVSLKPAVIKIREIILNSSKDLKEGIKWRSPVFYINENICGINIHKNHINLQFFHGAQFDTENILEGSGTGMRHLKIVKIQDVDEKVISSLMKKAIKYDKSLE
jgi:hypothetical protein